MSINMVSEIVQKNISEIKPYVRNPRKHDKTVELLVKVIPKVGFNVPIVIDKEGVIVKGHARFTAAIRLKMDKVPCVVTYADEETIKLDRIADNKVSEFSEWMTEGLIEELKSMTIDFDYSSLGLPDMREMELPEMGVDDVVASPAPEAVSYIPPAFSNTVQPSANVGQETPTINKTVNIYQDSSADIPPKVTARYMKAICPHCGKVRYIPEDQLEFK